MGVPLLRIGPALVLAASAAGCSSISVSEGAADPGGNPALGEIRVRTPRKGSDAQARGYTILLTAPDGSLVAHVASGGGPWAFEDLPPGRYDVRFAGKKIRPFSVDVKVKGGRRSTVTFHPWKERGATAANDLVEVTGKTLLYTVAGVVYVPLLLIEATLHDDDDEDDDVQVEIRASNDKTRRRDRPPEPEPKDEGSPRPRVRSLLKEP
jgi:hypothetical protein